MNQIQEVITDLQAVLDTLATDPTNKAKLTELLFKAQVDLAKATKEVVGVGDDGTRTV